MEKVIKEANNYIKIVDGFGCIVLNDKPIVTNLRFSNIQKSNQENNMSAVMDELLNKFKQFGISYTEYEIDEDGNIKEIG